MAKSAASFDKKINSNQPDAPGVVGFPDGLLALSVAGSTTAIVDRRSGSLLDLASIIPKSPSIVASFLPFPWFPPAAKAQ